MSSPVPEAVDEVLAKLAKDIESAVHSMYRGQVGQNTAKVRTEHFVRDARDRIGAFVKSTPAFRASGEQPRFSAVSVATSVATDGDAVDWTPEEAAAVTKCVTAWLPAGSPKSAKPDSLCMASGKELLPSWAERELARAAIRKVRMGG